MAIFAATDYVVTCGGTALSDHVVAVELTLGRNALDSAAMGDTYEQATGGLRTASVTIGFQQDHAAASVDAALWGLYNTTAGTAVVNIRPTSAAVSASNPSYEGTFLVEEHQPVSGKIGDLAVASVTWPIAQGTIHRATS